MDKTGKILLTILCVLSILFLSGLVTLLWIEVFNQLKEL